MLPHGGAFASPEENRLEVTYYLDTYFNLDRRYSAPNAALYSNPNAIFKPPYLVFDLLP